MIYTIKRTNGKLPKALSGKFESYDKARQAVRKWVLKNIHIGRLIDDAVDATNRTVSIGKHGFAIAKVV